MLGITYLTCIVTIVSIAINDADYSNTEIVNTKKLTYKTSLSHIKTKQLMDKNEHYK